MVLSPTLEGGGKVLFVGMSAPRRRGLLPRSQPLRHLSGCQGSNGRLGCWQWGVAGRGNFIRHLSVPSILGRGTCPSDCGPGPRHLAGIFEAPVLGMEGRAALVRRILLPLLLTWFVCWGMSVFFVGLGLLWKWIHSLPTQRCPFVTLCALGIGAGTGLPLP